MTENKKYIELKDLEVYQLSRKLSSLAWSGYSSLNFEQKKIVGDQFIRSADSVGDNIAEGYSRYHFRDKVRFYYMSRTSHSETIEHWAELMPERKIISATQYQELENTSKPLQIKLNNFITSTLKNVKG